MARARTMFASSVCCSDDFIDLPKSAQALYLQLCMNADPDGYIVGINSLIRACDADRSDLDRLIEFGFILPVGDVYVVRHWWTSNKYDKSNYKKARTMSDEYGNLLCFEGEEYKSAYRLAGSEEENKTESSLNLAPNIKQSNASEIEGESKADVSYLNSANNELKKMEGSPPSSPNDKKPPFGVFACDKCGATISGNSYESFNEASGHYRYRCKECGHEFENW